MAQPTPSFKAQPRKPRLKLPPGATDTHFRVFWPQARFPFAPERTDWPHPNLAVVPDDGDLLALIAEIAPTEAARQRLLADNPRRLYGFAA